MRKIGNKISNAFYALFGSMKIVNDEMLTQSTHSDTSGVTINKHVESNRVSKDLLEGQETLQVQELRYRTYLTDRESKKFEVYSPYLAKRRDEIPNLESNQVELLNDENLPVITIQENYPEIETVIDGLNQVGEKGKKTNHLVSIQRNNLLYIIRYKLEDFLKKVVVRELDNEKGLVLLDLYFTKYPDDENYLSKGFIREIEKVLNEQYRSEILNFDKLGFETVNAYKCEDMVQFEFIYPRFQYVTEFDGNYVLTYKAKYSFEAKDLTEKYYSKTMDDKYSQKREKKMSANIEDFRYEDTFICEACGKEVKYEPDKIDDMKVSEDPRNTRNLEYFDIQMAEQTFGKRLCLDCLRKKYKELTIKQWTY